MPDRDELPLNERKRAFSMAYLRAVSAVVGYSVSVPESDYDSVDLIVRSRQGKRMGLEFQVKCSARDDLRGDAFPFSLSKKNYDDLRADSILPRYLLVVLVPDDIGFWLRQNERLMLYRRCGYWTSLRSLEPRPDQDSITVPIARANILTPDALRALMARGT
jgi:hypothetical protein